jgi:hypothetical protein
MDGPEAIEEVGQFDVCFGPGDADGRVHVVLLLLESHIFE